MLNTADYNFVRLKYLDDGQSKNGMANLYSGPLRRFTIANVAKTPRNVLDDPGRNGAHLKDQAGQGQATEGRDSGAPAAAKPVNAASVRWPWSAPKNQDDTVYASEMPNN